jgi:hypothetical protein
VSRWVEEFESHPFQNTWNGLKGVLAGATVDDETVLTSVTELARLKKVTSFLDEMIHSLDPELVPTATWDSFNSQAVPCAQQIQAYNDNRNISHIRQANAHADNLLTYIRPYMIAAGKAGKALQEAVTSYAKTVGEHAEAYRNKSNGLVEEINSNLGQSKALLTSIENTENSIGEYYRTLYGDEAGEEGIASKVKELVEDFQKKNDKLVELYNETFVGDADTQSTQDEIEQAKELAKENSEQIRNLLKDIAPDVENLAKFHIKIFGEKNDDDELEGGLAGELNTRIKSLDAFETKQQSKYAALNSQIESLLPGATSAGLASAYLDMKDSFNTPIRNMSLVFYISIALLVVASMLLAIDSVGLFYINFVKIGQWDSVLKSIVYKLPFYAPILWLAYYASKRRSEYQRLQQEYAHKEALAKSYDSYKKQLEELDAKDIEMRKQFITKAIDAIAYNASITLDGKHGEKMPLLEMIEKAVEEAVKKSKP